MTAPRIITLTPNPALDFSFETGKLEPNRKLRCSSPRTDPGGGGINVSRAAKRLDAETLAIFTAGGLYGDALKEAIAREGVDARMVPVAKTTRPAFHVRETETGAEYRFNFPGEELTGGEIGALFTALAEETHAGDYVVGSGSLPPGAPPDFWAQAARIAKRSSANFVLDSSRGVRKALAEGIFLLRLNKADAAALAGRELAWPDEAAAFAKSIVAKGGADRVVITHGGDGGLMASDEGVAYAPAPKVPVVSAVGAGDSMVAALVAALMRGMRDDESLGYALAAAAATLKTPGTMLFDPDEVHRIFAQRPDQSA